MGTALKEEQSKSIQMGTVVKYLEKTKEELEEKFKLAMQNNAKEVQKVQETSLQMKELSIKLLEEEKKKAEVEATLVLREKQEKKGDVKKLEESIKNMRTGVEQKEVAIKDLQQKLKSAEQKNIGLEADKAKIKDLEEQCA